jgi:hypothetical protein
VLWVGVEVEDCFLLEPKKLRKEDIEVPYTSPGRVVRSVRDNRECGKLLALRLSEGEGGGVSRQTQTAWGR